MVVQVTGLKAGDFVHTLGDAHIYLNHLEQVKLQLSREPRALPQMKINPDVKSIFDFTYEDFELVNYNPHSTYCRKSSGIERCSSIIKRPFDYIRLYD